ncbi:Nif3-like dinuclear metal center hexameric protein, partial [Acinetobacter baumannii]
KTIFNIPVVKHTRLTGRPIKKVSICGGAGIFLLKNAINYGSDAYVTSDVKYHEFFDADRQLLLADIGHYESEHFTIDLLANLLEQKFP